jgi:hypothetical protein
MLPIVIAASPCRAMSNYGDSVLNGCYSYGMHTTNTSPALTGDGKAHVGVACFSPINSSVGTLTGGVWNDVNGASASATYVGTSSFAATNFPASGMGTITVAGTPYAVSTNKVVAGVAQGFQFMKIGGSPTAWILGGTAYYQGPSTTVFNNTFLSGCYSYFGETTDTAPVLSGNGKDLLGTLCFDGLGSVNRGFWRDVNGPITVYPAPIITYTSGTYSITSTPGLGMGSITFSGGDVWAIALNNVVGGVAQGFQFMLTNAAGNTKIFSGTAYYQGP